VSAQKSFETGEGTRAVYGAQQPSHHPECIVPHPRGVNDVVWCPYGNTPVFLKYDHEHGGQPVCDGCNGNFEPETHEFLFSVRKPRWAGQ
jgi:hypothetical protein